MRIATVTYQRYLSSTGIRKKVWSAVRRRLIQLLRDPVCSLPIHGRSLNLPLSHELPANLAQWPFYDRLPRRIGEYVNQTQDHLCCIDVGANIGDTIAAFNTRETDTFLAIEPNPRFSRLLVENWRWNKRVTMVSYICSSRNVDATYLIRDMAGTASIVKAENGISLSSRRLDAVVNEYPFAANANVLKIDTDGHDFEVIAGAEEFISRRHPMILFECGVFDNANYIEDSIGVLGILRGLGYRNFLLYDNVGNLMGKYSLTELSPFRSLLFNQLTGGIQYFDVLIMMDDDITRFHRSEIEFFVDQMPRKTLQRTARVAVQS